MTKSNSMNLKAKQITIIIGILFIVIYLVCSFLQSNDPISKFFKENKIGDNVVRIQTEELPNLSKILVESDGANFLVFLNNDTVTKVYLGTGTTYPMYSLKDNDVTFDMYDTKRIENSRKLLKEIKNKGYVTSINNEIKSKLKYPETFNYITGKSIDLGRTYVFNIKYSANNSYGIPATYFSKYEYNLLTGEAKHIETINLN